MSFSQDETSEMFIGEWAEKRGIRDQLVIATKVENIRTPTTCARLTRIVICVVHGKFQTWE